MQVTLAARSLTGVEQDWSDWQLSPPLVGSLGYYGPEYGLLLGFWLMASVKITAGLARCVRFRTGFGLTPFWIDPRTEQGWLRTLGFFLYCMHLSFHLLLFNIIRLFQSLWPSDVWSFWLFLQQNANGACEPAAVGQSLKMWHLNFPSPFQIKCFYLVEQSEHVPQQVRHRHIQELSKVVQVQLLAL